MSGRQVGVVASVSAALSVVVLVVGVLVGAADRTTFVVGSSVVAVAVLVVGLLTGVGLAVGGAYVLAASATVASILADAVGPLRAAVVGLVLFGSSELARLSLDARQPCRFDRRVLERIAGRLALTAGAVVAVVVLVAFVDGVTLPRLLIPLGVVAAVAVLGVLVAAGRLPAGLDHTRVLAAGVVIAVVVFAALAAQTVEQGRGDDAPAGEEEVVEATPVLQPGDGTGDEDELSPQTIITMRVVLIVLLAVIALLLGGVLLVPSAALTLDPYELDPDDDLVMSGGGLADVEEITDDVGAEEALAAIDDALADLDSDLEPGLAVRLAYDRVQSGFGHPDLARRPSESEIEYLGRLLTVRGVSAPAMARLTDLFEQARFSEHRIDETMRAEAVTAFQTVRAELAPTAGAGR